MSASLLLSLALAASAAPPAAPPTASTAAVRISDDDRRRALFLADLLLEEGRLDEAEAFLAERYALGLDTAAWTVRKARLRSDQRRHAESAEIYRALLKDAPDDSGLMLQLGGQESSAGRPDEARKVLTAARAKSSDPVIPYQLAELEFSEDNQTEGRRWAEDALKQIPPAAQANFVAMRLRLKGRLRFDDALESEYGAQAERFPLAYDLLYDWTAALLRVGAVREAGEPLALMRERFPARDLSVRRMEAERLRRLGDREKAREHLARSLALYPGDPDFLYSWAEESTREKDWASAEVAALRLSSSPAPAYASAAAELLLEARAGGRVHAGPTARWRDSKDTRVVETGAAAYGVPKRGWRARADANRAAYTRKSAGTTAAVSGLHAEAARVRRDWEAGLDADLRGGNGQSVLSPGVFGSYGRSDAFGLEGRGSVRRLWADSPEAAAAGVLTDDVEGVVRVRPLARLALSLQGSYNRLSARSGGEARQTTLSPEAVLVLLDRPLFVAAGYRHSRVDASGDAAFFSVLPLSRRSRAHYASLSAGARGFEGRLKADGYVFNGHEPERGRRFGSGDLLGFGVSVQAALGRVLLAVGYDLSLEDVAGVGGRSDSLRLSALWRFGGDGLPAAEERAR